MQIFMHEAPGGLTWSLTVSLHFTRPSLVCWCCHFLQPRSLRGVSEPCVRVPGFKSQLPSLLRQQVMAECSGAHHALRRPELDSCLLTLPGPALALASIWKVDQLIGVLDLESVLYEQSCALPAPCLT